MFLHIFYGHNTFAINSQDNRKRFEIELMFSSNMTFQKNIKISVKYSVEKNIYKGHIKKQLCYV